MIDYILTISEPSYVVINTLLNLIAFFTPKCVFCKFSLHFIIIISK